jgi:hypothetical protein
MKGEQFIGVYFAAGSALFSISFVSDGVVVDVLK